MLSQYDDREYVRRFLKAGRLRLRAEEDGGCRPDGSHPGRSPRRTRARSRRRARGDAGAARRRPTARGCSRSLRIAHRSRETGAEAGRRRTEQQGSRRTAGHQREDGDVAPRAHHGEARTCTAGPSSSGSQSSRASSESKARAESHPRHQRRSTVLSCGVPPPVCSPQGSGSAARPAPGPAYALSSDRSARFSRAACFASRSRRRPAR